MLDGAVVPPAHAEPAGHTVQSAARTRFVALLYVPGGQGLSIDDVAPTRQKKPAAHGCGRRFRPPVAKSHHDPAGHDRQSAERVVEMPFENVPGGHGLSVGKIVFCGQK